MPLEGPAFTGAAPSASSPGHGVSGEGLSDVWWQRGSGAPRLLFVARPSAACVAALSALLDDSGVLGVLGDDVFSFDLLHQSLSDRYVDRPWIRERLLLAGERVRAQAFTLTLDRLQCAANDHGSANVDVRMQGGSAALAGLVETINAAIAGQGLPPGKGHSAHVTVSYGFCGQMPRTRTIPDIDVAIDAFELVAGSGTPYRYTTLGRWPLGAQQARVAQAALF